MIRRFNYTNRGKVEQKSLYLKLVQGENSPSVLSFNVDESILAEFPSDSVCILEAYVNKRLQRFVLGSIEEFKPVDLVLSEFRPTEEPLFRFKVVHAKESNGLLVAWADRLKAISYDKDGSRRKTILSVDQVDLGDQVWRLKFETEGHPVLEVNSRINDGRSIATIVEHDPDFAGLVFPAIIRSILEHFFLREDWTASFDQSNVWIEFISGLGAEIPSVDDPPTNAELEEWVDDVVALYAGVIDASGKYIEYKKVKS